MHRKLAVVTVVASALINLAPTFAGTKDLESAIFQTTVPFAGDPHVSIDTRREYVAALRRYWQNFNSRVPRLSPSESAWVTEEIGEQGERLTRALNSKEYALFALALDIDGCLASLDRLDDAYVNPAQAQTEMFHWLGVVRCYHDLDTMIDLLQQAGLSNGKFDGPFYAAGSGLIMRTLLDKIIPSAMADTMDWTFSAD